MQIRKYEDKDFNAVCDFLIELNKVNHNHINWNWARFEWMYEHPEHKKEYKDKITLLYDGEKIVGANIYDMYLGEAFCGVLPQYDSFYEEMLDYCYNTLKDESGLGIAIDEEDFLGIEKAIASGFVKTDDKEIILMKELDGKNEYELDSSFSICEFDPSENVEEFAWILWQGFDHGNDRGIFIKEDPKIIQNRIHLNKKLSLVIKNNHGINVAYACFWYNQKTNYCYVEPVCTIPEYRGLGLGRILMYELMNRAYKMGAKSCFVISDLQFYKKIGFNRYKTFSFYRK